MADNILTMRQRKNIGTAFSYILLTGVGLLMIYPLLWMIGAAFKTNAEIFSSISIWPQHPKLDGFIKGWQTSTEYTFATFFLNSFKIVIPKIIFTAISTVLTAYAFTQFHIPFKKVWFSLLIATLLLPDTVLRIPQYLLFRDFGWLDTFKPLTVPALFAVDTFFVFMLIQFFRGIPKDLSESAKLDGCNSFQTLIFILVPVLKPAIISVVLFQFMWTMNDFMGPLIYLSSVENYPVSIALKMSMDASSAVDWSQILAMSVTVLLPSLIVFFMAQKYFVEGIATSGMKG